MYAGQSIIFVFMSLCTYKGPYMYEHILYSKDYNT